jgi:uncharacterized membrane protein
VTPARLEAFSDAVLAIIITIMVLELPAPRGTEWRALRLVAPEFLGYVMSFLYLGIYWNNHHHLFQVTRRVTGLMLWANLHLLFWLALIPYFTAWMGGTRFAAQPTAAYGLILVCAATAYWLLQRVILRSEGPVSMLAEAVGREWEVKLSLLVYLAAIAATAIEPRIAGVLYACGALLWLVPNPRIERILTARRDDATPGSRP